MARRAVRSRPRAPIWRGRDEELAGRCRSLGAIVPRGRKRRPAARRGGRGDWWPVDAGTGRGLLLLRTGRSGFSSESRLACDSACREAGRAGPKRRRPAAWGPLRGGSCGLAGLCREKASHLLCWDKAIFRRRYVGRLSSLSLHTCSTIRRSRPILVY